MIEAINKGADGLIRSADIRTSTGKTNRPICRLYPLEVTASDNTKGATSQTTCNNVDPDTDLPTRPIRDAARKGREQLQQWTALLRAPPEDVTENDL